MNRSRSVLRGAGLLVLGLALAACERTPATAPDDTDLETLFAADAAALEAERLAQAAEAARGLAGGRVPRQPVEVSGRAAGIFGAVFLVGEERRGRGQLRLLTRASREIYEVRRAEVVCEAGEPVAVVLAGTATIEATGRGEWTGPFQARVRATPNRPESLAVAISTAAELPPRLLVAEGELRFRPTACTGGR